MNIAELKGERNVKTLAKRLLAEPSKKTKKTTNAEMEAALLRLNPQLSRIGDLEKGTPILVPDEFALAADESFAPSRGLTAELLRQTEDAVSRLRAVLKERTERSAEETERVATWLKSAQAKAFLQKDPKLKEVFARASAAAEALPKEQDKAIAAREKALDKVVAQMASFRRASGAE
jgi:hypothetical protein